MKVVLRGQKRPEKELATLTDKHYCMASCVWFEFSLHTYLLERARVSERGGAYSQTGNEKRTATLTKSIYKRTNATTCETTSVGGFSTAVLIVDIIIQQTNILN